MPQKFPLSEVTALRPAAPSPFACTVRATGEQEARVHVSGEIDLFVAAELQRGLRSALCRARDVVVDLREVTFMETSGLHGLIAASDDAGRDGRHVTVLTGSAVVERLLDLTGAAAQLDVDRQAVAPSAARASARAAWPTTA